MLAGAVTLVAALAALLAGEGLLALVALTIGALLAGRQLLLRRFERHALDEGQLFARGGWCKPRLTIATRARLHSVGLGQGPLARWRGYACLTFGLAGGRLRMRGVPLAEARAIRAAVLASIVAVDFSQLPR